jgi:uncharacterized LabA/DUF88 family protein
VYHTKEVTCASERGVQVFCFSDKIETMKRAHIFIDGGNFYHLVLKKLGITELDFDFERFAIFLANDRTIAEMGKRYYIGTVPEKEGDQKSKEAMSKQTTLFDTLKKTDWQIKTSKLRRRNEEINIDARVLNYERIRALGIEKIEYERFREKGIDVKLATDLIVGAIDNKYDTAILVSSDGDLIPALDWIRNRTKKKIEYVGFSILDKENEKKSTNPLITLLSKTDTKRILVESDLKPFIQQKLFKN